MIGPAGGRLLSLIAADLPDHSQADDSDGLAVFVGGDGSELVVGSRVKRRFLGRTETAVFQTTTAAPAIGPAHLRVRQTGMLRRGEVVVEVVAGSEEAGALADRLSSDPELTSAVGVLDFTRFELVFEDGRCTTTVELVGGSMVAIALPPIRSYIRLHPDQRHALIRCLRGVSELVAR